METVARGDRSGRSLRVVEAKNRPICQGTLRFRDSVGVLQAAGGLDSCAWRTTEGGVSAYRNKWEPSRALIPASTPGRQ